MVQTRSFVCIGRSLGAVHKVRQARGGGSPRRCYSLWQGEGEVKSMWRYTTYKKNYYTYETWNLKRCLTFCCNRCILQKGERTKTTPDKTFQTKDPADTPPDKKPCEQLRKNLYRGLLPGFSCTRPTKNRGWPRCVTYSWGVPGCVTKCDKGEGG